MPAVWLLLLALPLRAEPLPSWNDTPTRRALESFVSAALRRDGPGYVEPAARVAVFDFDGTLAVEAPVYGQVSFSVWRLERRKAALPPERVQRLAAKIRALPPDRLVELSWDDTVELWALGLSGASGGEVQRDADEWLRTDIHPRFGRTRGELLYEPMREVIAWLKTRGFKVYIVSGSTQDFLRAFAEERLGVPRENVIGSELEPAFAEAAPFEVERRGSFRELVDKDRKVVEIDRRIGRRPVVAFGNSDGDVAMLTYAAKGPRPGFAAFVHHDDAEREFAYDRGSPVGALSRGLDVAAERGLRLISMKRDWKRVFAPAKAPAREPAAAPR
ncbi:MAG: haloacid dehalogenase-like hydrolase [Elusimicrobia bacterium]|nr:haloacid dehalogenase-like hydrolase [Elusimicrobiota bacterium]